MADAPKKEGKMTVFKTDRHEDFAAIVLVLFVVGGYLLYMAFGKDHIDVKAPGSGKVLSIDAAPGARVKPGDKLFTYESKVKKFIGGELKEEVKNATYKAKTPGVVAEFKIKPGDKLDKGKTKVMVFNHDKGTLP